MLVAAAGRPVGEILREQLRANPANAPILGEAMAAIDSLEAGKRVDVAGMNPALMPLHWPQGAGILIDASPMTPPSWSRRSDDAGDPARQRFDIQVGVADAERLKQAAPKAELALLADTRHLPENRDPRIDWRANGATYADPEAGRWESSMRSPTSSPPRAKGGNAPPQRRNTYV